MKNRGFFHRLGFALDGIRIVWLSEKSFQTQVVFACAAAIALLILRPGWSWTALVVISTGFVLALELLNSALEYLIDHIHPDLAPAIKHAKDAAAGAVLVASGTAVLVAVLMLASVLTGDPK